MGRLRSLPLGLAAGGVVGGHAIAYVLAYPLIESRDAHLQQTGHHGFHLIFVAGLAAAAVALVLTFVRAARSRGPAPSLRALLPLQVVLFLSLELAERGFDPALTGADPAVVLGVVVQVVLACVLVWLARGAAAAGRLLAPAPGRGSSPPGGSVAPTRLAEPRRPDPVALGPRRGPPSLVAG